jgi:hypothetical protein
MRKDGTIMIRNEVYDVTDPVRKDMDQTYKHEIEEANKGKARQSSMGSMGMMMGMGSMGGKMGGGRR